MEFDESKSTGPAPFLYKTYDMVDDSATDAVVSWSDRNNSFIVWKSEEFARDLLPKYFKHSNFSSFVRQLNTYGFGKVDPDRWEFANDEFLRGERHLLKNIHRRKPVAHHHTTQQQQTQGSTLGSWVEVGKFGLEGEVERLKRERNVLMVELMQLRVQQQTTENDLQQLGKRLRHTEKRQRQMMSFLAKALNNPSFVAQLVQQNENNKRLNTDRKRKRVPRQEIEGDSVALDYDGQIVRYQSAVSESARTKLMPLLNNSELSSRCDTGKNPFEALLATDATSLDHECDRYLRDSDLIPSNLTATASPLDLYSPVPGQSGNEGLIVSEVEQNEESRTPSGTTGTNDVFWEKFLTASPESRRTSSDGAETVESAEQQADKENVNWWNSTPSMDRLAEQMGQLAD